jgi:hypothetical protein
MGRLHEIAPESFYGWADQRAKARIVGGHSRAEGANEALGGILKHYYGSVTGDPAQWVPLVDAMVGDDTGWKIGTMSQDQLAAVFVKALVGYLTRMSDPSKPKRSRKKAAA